MTFPLDFQEKVSLLACPSRLACGSCVRLYPSPFLRFALGFIPLIHSSTYSLSSSPLLHLLPSFLPSSLPIPLFSLPPFPLPLPPALSLAHSQRVLLPVYLQYPRTLGPPMMPISDLLRRSLYLRLIRPGFVLSVFTSFFVLSFCSSLPP